MRCRLGSHPPTRIEQAAAAAARRGDRVLLIGAWVDRVHRKRLMILTNLARGDRGPPVPDPLRLRVSPGRAERYLVQAAVSRA